MIKLLSSPRLLPILFLLAFSVSGCKKDEDPAPQAYFTLYTQIESDFDRLDVYIDGKLAGSITATSAAIPDCGKQATESVFTTAVTAGPRAIEVKQILENKEVGIWDDWTITFKEDECVRKKLTE
ncbi:hypothetical protein [Dyadobacter fermentans]|uniref:Lipoprotein n=1 Tax=Dyadobacter fermentans (strain ATCC 700827 / DSM 18053 / CIP 107007 / KCTC 52180 / NS114) TaxID=471854 RepID=C6VZU3_DYAFD|nr:hypothetical protein [Dyadobacter fermentans]ACT93571.1 hypothetical protein Dfer_2352 [Dyadobacter fermentans DSM 18053]